MKRLLLGYVVLVAVAASLMAWRLSGSTPAPTPKGSDMQWSQVQEVTVPARPAGIWTWAVDYVKGPARILVEAAAGGTWVYSQGRPACGPDGDLEALLASNRTIVPSAPTGALILKIGGSTAGTSDGTIRVAGSKAYFEVDASVSGALFLTINDELGGLADNSGELKVKISIAPMPAPAAAPPATP